MSVLKRNNVKVFGSGSTTIMFAHGFGCDQNMWRFVAPAFAKDYQIVLFDLVGAGGSDWSAFSFEKYASLDGYADDVVEIANELELKDAIFVGHSVSAMIGVLAANKAPVYLKNWCWSALRQNILTMGNYVGGFTETSNR